MFPDRKIVANCSRRASQKFVSQDLSDVADLFSELHARVGTGKISDVCLPLILNCLAVIGKEVDTRGIRFETYFGYPFSLASGVLHFS